MYVVAGVFELAGIVLVFFDLHDVRDRLRSYRTAPKTVHLRTAAVAATIPPVTIRIDPPPPLETRLQNLESAVQQHHEQYAEDIPKLKEYARGQASEAIDYMHNSLGTELTRLLDLVFSVNDPKEQGWRRWWLGPALLAAGLVLGVIGNIVSALTSAR